MPERNEQTEQERRKAYMDGFKAGFDALYTMIAEGAGRGAAFQAVLRFHDNDLFVWSQRDLTQPLPPPAAVVR